MTKRNEYFQTNLHPVVKGFKWLHAHPHSIVGVAIATVAMMLGASLDFSQILTNPMALIGGGLGVFVGLHVLGVSAFAFWAHRRRLRRQLSSHSQKSKS
jgi:Na+-transporting methylmalonyl-CoA/oxaloacetate decarboxylase beta subunit